MSDKTLTPQLIALHYGCEVKVISTDAVGRLIGSDDHTVLLDLGGGARLAPKQDTIKLCLRPLSSMTEEEGKRCIEIVYAIPDYPLREYKLELVGQEGREANPRISIHNDWWDYSLTFGNAKGSVWAIDGTPANTKISMELFLYLLSRGFDLFNLLESGNAILKQ